MSESNPEDRERVIKTNPNGKAATVWHLYPDECPCLTDSAVRPVSEVRIDRRDLPLCEQCRRRRDDFESASERERDPDWSPYQSLRDADADDVFVYVAPSTTNPVFHSDRACHQLEDEAEPRVQADLPERFRECERCRYDGVPALEDAGGDRAAEADRATVSPFVVAHLVVALAAVLIVLGLFAGVVGGLL